ncbi:uncharacterized protein LOC112160159 [Oryzias melastigma]|uniref:uncharacterized protein LOC112160159 n=1 Tax=Oryzias melastigma TaxID=30732 RepID=UPI000CF7F41C|nr:uncharacterized protein LOC112160159 [Oryzias melastigma]XP_036070405.1 uncharacterized protein LOC112160159 [Oryzias melastigma]
MARCDACFLLLLRLSLCFNSEVTLVKTVRGDPDVTPVCSGATLQNITLMVCKIRTKWRREGCRVHYQHQQNFSSECGSRFRLVTENQTMFLQMTNLRVEDGGNHTCECSHRHGNDVLHLQVTVEEDAKEGGVSDVSVLGVTTAVSSASGLFMVAAALLGLFLRKVAFRAQRQSELQRPSSKGDEDSTYASLQQPTGDLYQTVERCGPAPKVPRVMWVKQEDEDSEIYENL